MAFDIDELLKKDVFQKLGQERIDAFKTLAAELNGKSGPTAVNVLMGFNKIMPKGAPLSPEEQQAMLETIMDCLPPEDKEKFQGILKLFGQRREA